MKNLLTAQQELDNLISINKRIPKQQIISDKLVALIVEMGELANEKPFFKFWKKKKIEQERRIILEEYVDVLHFFLSLTNELDLTDKVTLPTIADEERILKTDSLTERFLAIISAVTNSYNQTQPGLMNKWHEANFVVAFKHFILFGTKDLKFSLDEITEHYYLKHQKNLHRQYMGY